MSKPTDLKITVVGSAIECRASLELDPHWITWAIDWARATMNQQGWTAKVVEMLTALDEALTNALHHGCLELDSTLRENDRPAWVSLFQHRRSSPPYCDRRVYIHFVVDHHNVQFTVRDDGPGFAPASIPDPRLPDNIVKARGRGLLLMRTFMEVAYNDLGNEVVMIGSLEQQLATN